MNKICKACGFSGTKGEFPGSGNLLCKPCMSKYVKKVSKRTKKDSKEYDLNYRYGISIDDYNKMFDEQNGCCGVCGRHQVEFKRKLAVDHCHETGKVRGLLCTSCNVSLGHLKNDPEIIKRLVDYLS